MKRFVGILLLSIYWTGSSALLLDRGSVETPKSEERSLESEQNYMQIVKDMIEDVSSNNLVEEDAGSSKTLYLDNSKKAFIKVTTPQDNKEVTLSFENELEKALLQLNNIDLSNKESDDYLNIKNKYVKAFVDGSKEIIESDEALESTIYDISKSMKVEGLVFNEQLKEFAEESVGEANPEDDQDVQKNGASKKRIVLVYEIKTGTNYEVILHSTYFSSSFFVNIKTRAYLEKELYKLVTDAYKHAKRMVRFNTSNQDSISHTIDCESVKAALTAVNEEFKLITDTEGSVSDNTVTYAVKDGHSISYTCNEGDFISVDVQYQRQSADGQSEAPEPKVFLQGFMKSSLYDLKPVIESFFDDIFLHAARAFGFPEPNTTSAERKAKRVKRMRA